MIKTNGQIAYEAYCEHTHWKSLVNGKALPPWAEVKPEIKETWEATAEALFKAFAVDRLTSATLSAEVVREARLPSEVRDEFAGEALNGLIQKWGIIDKESIAKSAFEFADHMMAERAKPKPD